MNDIMEKAKEVEEFVISFRRELHRHPELSSQEFETQKKIMAELDRLGISYRKAGSTSLIASLKGASPGKTVALRGDIDALPIKEESGVEYASEHEGVMHACGHDAHTAMLLGAARILSQMKDQIAGEIRFFFQEAEETFSGAQRIVEDGGMDGVDAVFGMHGMAEMAPGEANIQEGYRMAGCDTIYVRFEGVSGHGSVPHKAKDTIHPAALFVTDLQGIVTKENNSQDPLVLSVGRFSGGTKANVIAKFTELDITMRYFSAKARQIAHEGIRRHAQAVADAWQIKADVRIEESTPSLFNDPDLARLAQSSFAKVAGEGKIRELPKYMGSEDMPYYFQKAKGVYAFMGYYNEVKGSVHFPHHEKFRIDEDYMKFGTALHVQFALDFLGQKEPE